MGSNNLLSDFKQIRKNDFQTLQKSVVTVQVRHKHFMGVGESGSFFGSGFVIDKKLGLIATNEHVVPVYSNHITVSLPNGELTSAKRIYTDHFHDYSIIQIDINDLEYELDEVEFADYQKLHEGQSVFLIGCNDGQPNSVKTGIIISLNKDSSGHHAQTMQTSFDRTGGSSGSPILNENGQVVAIHTSGTDTTSYELSANYIKDRLTMIREDQMRRNELGLWCRTASIYEAKNYFNAKKETLRELFGDDVKEVIAVYSKIHGLDSYEKFELGDIIVSVNEQLIYSNFYLFDKIIDDEQSGKVKVKVLRRNELLEIEVNIVNVSSRPLRYATFEGGVFHEPDLYSRQYYNICEPGILLCQSSNGTAMDLVGIESGKTKRKAVLIKEINGNIINTFDDFIEAAKNISSNKHFSVKYRDILYNDPVRLGFFTPNSCNGAIEVFSYCKEQLQWI